MKKYIIAALTALGLGAAAAPAMAGGSFYVSSYVSAPSYSYVAPRYVAPAYVAPTYIAPSYHAPTVTYTRPYVAPTYVAPAYIAPTYYSRPTISFSFGTTHRYPKYRGYKKHRGHGHKHGNRHGHKHGHRGHHKH